MHIWYHRWWHSLREKWRSCSKAATAWTRWARVLQLRWKRCWVIRAHCWSDYSSPATGILHDSLQITSKMRITCTNRTKNVRISRILSRDFLQHGGQHNELHLHPQALLEVSPGARHLHGRRGEEHTIKSETAQGRAKVPRQRRAAAGQVRNAQLLSRAKCVREGAHQKAFGLFEEGHGSVGGEQSALLRVRHTNDRTPESVRRVSLRRRFLQIASKCDPWISANFRFASIFFAVTSSDRSGSQRSRSASTNTICSIACSAWSHDRPP